MDEGWTRWLFEQFEIPFTNVEDADIKAGNLEGRFDVLVLPSQSSEDIVEGNEEGTMPPKYVGGITREGAENIRDLRQGRRDPGHVELVVPLRHGLAGTAGEQCVEGPGTGGTTGSGTRHATGVHLSGIFLRMKFDTKHPVAYGMPEDGSGALPSESGLRYPSVL